MFESILLPTHLLQTLLPLVPPRPKSPFLIFANQHKLSESMTNVSKMLFGMGKELNIEWTSMTPEQKEPFIKLAEQDRKWWIRKMRLHEYTLYI